MPIDPSIILGIKPVQIQQPPDPIEQYGKSLALKNLLMQSQDDQATRDAYQQSGGDPATLKALLYKNGAYKAAQAQEKFQLEGEEKRSVIDKNKAEIPLKQQEVLVKATAFHRDALANVNDPQTAAEWVKAGYQDPILSPILSRAGPVEQAIARIPQDPQGFQQWKQQNALGATKFIEMNKPTVHMQDAGGASNIVSVPGLGGAPQVLSSTNKTQTPDSQASNATSRRNADMADARARDAVAQGKSQIVTDANGNITIVDKATGVGRAATDGKGQPLQGKQPALTESQGKASGMLLRATRSNEILNSLEDSGTKNRGIIKQAAGTVPLIGGALEMGVNSLPGVLGGPSDKQQQVEQARRDFVNAALRVESGAAISNSEFQNAEKQYFPMPGDSPDVLTQKRANRQSELDALKMQSGPTRVAQSIRPASQAAPAGGIKFLGFE